jgi:hypothetical protein
VVIFYSGFGCTISNPEVALGDKCNLMLTFADSRGRKDEVHPRFHAVWAARDRRERQFSKQTAVRQGRK